MTRDMTRSGEPLLRIDDVHVHYGRVIAVNGVDLTVSRGETLGLVGESGSGKSTLAMAILRLITPPGRIVSGRIHLNGVDILSTGGRQLRQLRWTDVSLIPQGSMNSLNPVMRIGDQIQDAIEAHDRRQTKDSLRQRVLSLLDMVRLPARVYGMYPHELSGGMKQRVCIAMAIALGPSLIIADEPTSALDVVVQKTVAETLLKVKEELNSSMILVGHDMALQAQLVDRIAVMYAGNIVEVAPVAELFSNPVHAYTRHLIASVPSITERKPLVVKEFQRPDLTTARPKPELREVSPGHLVALDDEHSDRRTSGEASEREEVIPRG
ncbi:ABC transporter ATP-binding protein [Jiangella asiatica]|uniref:ABC transporter ATP-binding protein n=1 Tax=Jiangella asiatica TaxID=2530372 RepID=A0A4R5DTT4_9ACTN|nr:ABC transporter ATP-binding protein [Jiangella asiatica]TDE14303.1 ABC transporter ATP-binding protein [Jiangella asiatica]